MLMLSMDRDIDVRTPESIEFTYALAGLGSRFLAWFVDFLIELGIIIAIFLTVAFIGSKLPSTGGVTDSTTSKLGVAIVVAFIVFIFFSIFFGYFIVLEAFWNGQTPGKKLLGIRVVRDGGYPIDFGASLIRNLIRVAELLIGFYALSAISATISPENKRLEISQPVRSSSVTRVWRFPPSMRCGTPSSRSTARRRFSRATSAR